KDAFAACAFVRCILNDGSVQVILLRAKSRVAPLNATIPRLELMACSVGARMGQGIRQALGLEEIQTFYWSDSSTAIWWIRNEGPWTVFVQNRVKEIRTLSNTSSWYHVPGVDNPADLLSRGCAPSKLLLLHWWEGP